MTQKFMLLAVAGYVLFAGFASIVATAPISNAGFARQFVIILARWCAIMTFAVASIAGSLQGSGVSRTRLIDTDLWSHTGLWPGVVLALAATAVIIAPVFLEKALKGWWSPLQWIQGLVGATALGVWAGASQGPIHTVIPDWRFIGASTVLWLVCLLLGAVALFISNGDRPLDRVSRCYRELLRLCSAAPPILIYLIGFQL